MDRLLKLQIFNSLLVLILMFSTGYSQGQTINFSWEDKDKNESAGVLLLEWQNDEVLKQWKLHINVTWYDSSGETISVTDKMPFIYLSDYDMEKRAVPGVRCLNFSVSSNIYDLKFQDSGELRFELPADTEDPGDLEIVFKYFLSPEEFENANINPISIPGREKVIIAIPDTRIPVDQNDERVIEAEEDTSDINEIVRGRENCIAVRSELVNLVLKLDEYSSLLVLEDAKIGSVRSKLPVIEPGDTAAKGELEKELLTSLSATNRAVNGIDSLVPEIRRVRKLINDGVMPNDSATLYRRDLGDVNENLSILRGEYIISRSQVNTMLQELGSTSPDLILSNQKKSIEDRYTSAFQIHLDSIQDIKNSYSQIEPGLLAEIRKGPRKARNNRVLDGFRSSHEQLRTRLDSIWDEHKNDYYSYRDGTENSGTGPIMSLENLHLRVDDIYVATGSSMNNMDLEISRLEAAINELNPRPTARNIIIAGSILLFIVLLIVIRRISLTMRKVNTAGMPATTGGEVGMIDIFDDKPEQTADYYKVMVPEDNQDMMLSEVHFHIRVIKSIYHLVQGALIDKKPEEFGGLMFGRQYRTNGNGRHILIVENVVEAANIRPGMVSGKEKGAELVDEIEKIVSGNKKAALLGWFTSSAAKDLEMPENQVKVHRIYFRDKWQIACLVHPGTDKLDSGLFIRRKSGYFDTIPASEYLLQWDDLYQFAVNPPLKSKLEEKIKPDPDDYLKIDLNRNWCDSIVEKAYIHPSVLVDMQTEKESKEQFAAGQIANGFFYGQVWKIEAEDKDKAQTAYEIFIEKLTTASGSEKPRELPGSELLGWLRFDTDEIFESLKKAIPYHTEVFGLPHQLAVLVNSQTDELRFFSRKHSMEMNNNTIETEEFNLASMLADIKNQQEQSENNIPG